MNPSLTPQLRENLRLAGDPARWFRSGAAGELVRPEVVETLLPGLTPELVPVLVREARPEGPTRKQALSVALRQRLAGRGGCLPTTPKPVDSVPTAPVQPVEVFGNQTASETHPAYAVGKAGQLALFT